METSTVSLLKKCQENFPYIKWTEDKDNKYCIGIIENTVFSVYVTSVEGHSSVKLKIDVEKNDMKEHTIDLIGRYSSEGKPIEALLADLRTEWEGLNSLLSRATKVSL
ncbi:hypothetical protein [Nostoc sp. ChiSLP03a]|uniref:hypothetical protein n=1 Tax=Nostoc sp. ChiSLP03a TaxID=3075380 RepID=UPI002AD29A43|nr:hypothetical protein [Nostoc sp. ChiSLP03a]MDZ8211637.1 hypothetical protein [Nostoc sp. ChiSLP03a]